MATLSKSKDLATGLISTLEEEAEDLKIGKLDRLEKFTERKLEDFKALDETLKKLQYKEQDAYLEDLFVKLNFLAAQNAHLLRGAYNGAKSAQDRIEKIQTADSRVGAYSRNGESLMISGSGISSEKSV